MEMARKYMMKFESRDARWRRMYRGKSYSVSCRQLGCGETAEASWKFANEWFARQILPVLIAKREELVALNHHYDDIPDLLAVSRETRHSVAKEDSFLVTINEWLQTCVERCQSGKDRPKTLGMKVSTGNALRDWWIAGEPKGDVNASLVETYHRHLTGLSLGDSAKRGRWLTFRMVLKYGWEKERWDMPRNLANDTFTFIAPAGKKDYWSPDEFRKCYSESSDLIKLVMLLHANCGFYASDCSQLGTLVGNRLTHTRVKTSETSEPTVYTLWPETIDLLAKCGDQLPKIWESSLVDGNPHKVYRLGGKLKHFPKQLRLLRHTSIHELDQSAEWSRFASVFAGHSPS